MRRTARDLLVIQDNIRQPDLLAGNVEDIDTAVLAGIPSKFIVVPFLGAPNENSKFSSVDSHLFQPDIGSHDLILLILEESCEREG